MNADYCCVEMFYLVLMFSKQLLNAVKSLTEREREREKRTHTLWERETYHKRRRWVGPSCTHRLREQNMILSTTSLHGLFGPLVLKEGGGREKQLKQACVVVRTAALGSLFQAVPKRVQRTEGTEQKKKKMRSLLKNASFISNLYERKKKKKSRKKLFSGQLMTPNTCRMLATA